MSPENPEELRVRLNAGTGRIGWGELAPHFARGALVRVAATLDLVEVAACFVENREASVADWMQAGLVARADDADARRWSADSPELWAVVVAPWVLVQEVNRDR